MRDGRDARRRAGGDHEPDPGKPEHFRLVKNGSRCVLLHEGSGKRLTLESATCSPR